MPRRKGADQLAHICKDCRNKQDRKRKALEKKSKTEKNKSVSRLPVEPFVLWLKETIPRYGNQEEFCATAEIGTRRVNELLSGRQTRVSLELVDRALTREGSSMLWELYPELYE